MSYSDSFPTQRPSLNLVFNGGSDQLDSRISFSRADSTPSAVHYWSNEKHLSSENLVPYSNLSSGFSFGRTTLASTNNSAPDGGSDAASILETAVSGSHEVYDTFASVSGQQYSFVFYLKANGRTKVIFKPQATSVIANVTFDLTAVTSAVTSGSADSHSITAIGSTSGWYKCAVTVTATATGTGYTQFNLVDSTGASTYTGDVTKGVYAWGASVSSTGQTVVNQTSGSIHREYSSTLKSVTTSGQPRFEYDPAADGQSVAKGLLVEAQATNLQRYGSAFASWSTRVGTSYTSNAAIAPNGLLGATLMTATSTSTYHYVNDTTISVANGTTYTASLYAKDAGQRYLQLFGAGSTFGLSQYATFDLQTGSVDANGVTASAESVGNGWWRIQATLTATSSGSSRISIALMPSATAARNQSWTANDYSGALLFGFQFETGSSASSLVDTGSLNSTLTRAADSCSLVSEQLFDNGGGTLYAEASRNGLDTYNGIASVDDGSGSNIVQIFGNSNNFRAEIGSGGTTVANMTASGHSASAYYKHCVAFSPTEAKYYVDGSQKGSTDTDLNIPAMSQMHLGMLNAATNGNLNGHLRRVSLYGQALSSTELAALTSS